MFLKAQIFFLMQISFHLYSMFSLSPTLTKHLPTFQGHSLLLEVMEASHGTSAPSWLQETFSVLTAVREGFQLMGRSLAKRVDLMGTGKLVP